MIPEGVMKYLLLYVTRGKTAVWGVHAGWEHPSDAYICREKFKQLKEESGIPTNSYRERLEFIDGRRFYFEDAVTHSKIKSQVFKAYKYTMSKKMAHILKDAFGEK